MTTRAIIAIGLLFLAAQQVEAQTLTECGDSDGYAYYFSGGAVPAKQSGLRPDGVTGGCIILNYINKEFDVITKNALGATLSVKQSGAPVIPMPSSDGLIGVMAMYPTGVLETCVFQLDSRGDGAVAWTVLRTNTHVNKVSLMKAQCRGPR